MSDFAQARRVMVDTQVRTADVTDAALLDALLTVPRERFVPEQWQALAYVDSDVPLGAGRFLIQPMVIAKLIQAAAIAASDVILDVGSGGGYGAAILARMGARVVALESDAALARSGHDALAVFAPEVEPVAGPLEVGWPAGAPYDVIVIEGAVDLVPQGLVDQLAEGGRLVAALGTGRAAKVTVNVKQGGLISGRPVFDAALPMLGAFRRPAVFSF